MKKSFRRLDTLRLEDRINPSFTYLPPSHFFAVNDYIADSSRQAPLDIAMSFLHERAGDFNLSAIDLADARVTANYTDLDSGVSHVYLRQVVNGLEVAYANLNVSIAPDGRVISAGGGFVPGLAEKLDASTTVPLNDARQAVEWAAAVLTNTDNQPTPGCCCNVCLQQLAAYSAHTMIDAPIQVFMSSNDVTQQSWVDAFISKEPIVAQLHYVPTADGGAELAWNTIIQTTDLQHWFDMSISDHSGIVLAVADWVADAAYNVVTLPAEHPNDGGFAVVVNPFDPQASPFGWHDTNGIAGPEFTDTRGNNVSAHLDRDANNVPDTNPPRPEGGPGLNFSQYSHNPALGPLVQQNADIAVVNLFYVNNALHDIHYMYGFTPPAGNFQINNYGLGGSGNDAVNADAQDGSGTNNANFATPPDGSAPRMQMFIWTQTTPNRDSSLDNGIIIHEYSHGVSNRLTGGPANSSALNSTQSGGMGEGWSDWHALMLTQKPTDKAEDARPIGTYALGQPSNGPGIRRRPYSFDMNINPLTWDAYGTSGTTSYGINRTTQVHASGEIWNSALWDMNWLLINKYGYDSNLYTGWQPGNGPDSAGNKLALRLVMDGMKLQPANPSFIQARNAILAADTNLTGGANHLEIWTAFARRGLGENASTSGATSTSVTVDFTIPAAVQKLNVKADTPAIGDTVEVAPSSFTLKLSDPINAASLQAADFSVNGIPADNVSYTPGSTTVTFEFNTTPVAAQGLQTMTIAAGAFTRSGDNDPVTAFASWFRYDAVPLEVVSSSPVPGSTLAPPLTFIDLNFNEPVAPASATLNSLQVSRGLVSGVSLLNGNQTVRFELEGVTGEGTLAFSVTAGAFTDAFGNPGAAFNGAVTLDIDVAPMPAFTAIEPLGSRVYLSQIDGVISSTTDIDTFTFEAAAGQITSILVTPEAGYRPQIVLRDVNNEIVFSTTGAAPGEPALLQSQPLLLSGTYSISVSSVDSTLGGYNVRALLNAAIEREGIIAGASNSTPATAQNLDGAFVQQSTGLGSASRAAVIGRTDTDSGFTIAAITPTFNDISLTGTKSTAAVGDDATDTLTQTQLNGFNFPLYGTVYDNVSFSTNGLITFNGSNNAWTPTDFSSSPPQAAVAALWLDLVVNNTGSGTSARNIFWKLDGTGQDQTLTIQWNNVRRVTSSTVFFTFQAVLGANGSIQYNYTPSLSSTFAVSVGMVGVKDEGTVDPARFVVSYKQQPGIYVGPNLSTLLAPEPPPADYYSFTLAAGETATVAANALATGALVLDIRDADGNVLASGFSGSDNLSQVVSNFSGAASKYFARVTGDQNVPYSLLVTRNADFDTEPNNSAATAQPLAAANGAIGHLAAGTDAADWYAITLPVGATVLEVETVTPGSGAGQPANLLDPKIELFDAAGTTLIASGTPLTDGLNERITVAGLMPGGSYRLRVGAENGTSGEYFVNHRVPPPPATSAITINDGASQRSRVTVLNVAFTTAVNLAPGAFQLGNGSFTLNSNPGGGISVSTSLVDGKTVARLTFEAVPGVEFGSLADGNWTLTVPAAAVTAVFGGTPMNADGIFTGIKRLFGDSVGNGTVDATDFAAFGAGFGLAVTPPNEAFSMFDFDSNGTIDAIDFAQFGSRFGVSI